jgi:hypothetical protein
MVEAQILIERLNKSVELTHAAAARNNEIVGQAGNLGDFEQDDVRSLPVREEVDDRMSEGRGIRQIQPPGKKPAVGVTY